MIDVLLTVAAIPPLAVGCYLAVLALVARERKAPPRGEPQLKFDIVIPAHNEESGIAGTVASVCGVDYPRRLFRVIVVADNCSDATAARAAAAGAEVLLRQDEVNRGKGYALDYAFNYSLVNGFADVVAVIDADTIVSRGFLRALAARAENGALAMQAHYGVRNPHSSWRTQMMHLAFTAAHVVRSLARERLGLSCGLRGNGMAFRTSVLRVVPHRAFSIVEDVEYGIALALAGIRVQYVAEAAVFADMCDSEQSSRPQRRRWEQGRLALARRKAGPLLREAWRRREPILLDLAIDLLVPPLAQVVALMGAGLAACAVAAWWGAAVGIAPWLWAAAMAGVCVYVARAWTLSKAGWRGFTSLLWVPIYVFWKLTLPLRGGLKTTAEWVRTPREQRT